VSSKYATFLVAAKCDLSEQEKVSIQEAGDFAKSIKADLHLTSAKEGTGVFELFTDVANKLNNMQLANEFDQVNANKVQNRESTTSFKIKRDLPNQSK
jgi:predicted GTPase